MNLKLLALAAVVISLCLFVLAFMYSIPIAYVPYGASKLEFIMSHITFVIIEASVLAFLFVYMIKTAKIEFHDEMSKILR